MPEPLLVKKYANRRLYDTEQSRYITLPELAATVRAGRDVTVVDARDGADRTRAVLVQVLLDEQERLDLLPKELLHHLVRAQGTLADGPLARWLADSLRQWEAVSRVARQGAGAAMPASAQALRDALEAAGLGARPPDPMQAVRAQMDALLAKLGQG